MYPRPDNLSSGSQFSSSVQQFSDDSVAAAERDLQCSTPRLALIGASPLLQECLLPAFWDRLHFNIAAFPSVDDRLLQKSAVGFDLVILFVSGPEPRRSIAAARELLDRLDQPPPLAVLADSEQANEVVAAFEYGARAYIPTSVTLDVMIEAIKLVGAGGTYYPLCVLSACANGSEAKQGSMQSLTPREMVVLDAIRHGLSNKVIAHELGISESTIKVHVHRIMKKLKVQNRTQAAICAAP